MSDVNVSPPETATGVVLQATTPPRKGDFTIFSRGPDSEKALEVRSPAESGAIRGKPTRLECAGIHGGELKDSDGDRSRSTVALGRGRDRRYALGNATDSAQSGDSRPVDGSHGTV